MPLIPFSSHYAAYPGNTPAKRPPTEACTIHSKQRRVCRVQDPGTRGYRRWKTANFSHSAGTPHGPPPTNVYRYKGMMCALAATRTGPHSQKAGSVVGDTRCQWYVCCVRELLVWGEAKGKCKEMEKSCDM